MIVGFTGTQLGMSQKQLDELTRILIRLAPCDLHHGDCIGADAEANEIAIGLGIKTGAHPPKNPKKRAYCECNTWFAPKEYIQRNHDIVDICEHLIIAPRTNTQVVRSGTWATYRYAKACGRPYTILER